MISVIIPTLNEERCLPLSLKSLRRQDAEFEVIVSDGGSTDRTLEIGRRAGIRIVESPPGRARQMNLAARVARGDILVFLHADTVLPSRALLKIERALNDPAIVGGGFARRFASSSRFLRFTCWLAEWRNRLVGFHLGDQAPFVRRDIFEAMDGFSVTDLHEDLDFAWRIRAYGKLATLTPPVRSSPRRFRARGPFVTTLHDFWLVIRSFIQIRSAVK